MRISLWQQFSSNHSAFYSITGTFKTVEEAQKAYSEIRLMLQIIDEWHRENPHGMRQHYESGIQEPLPIEKEFAERYGIKWSEPINWAGWGDYEVIHHPTYNIQFDPAVYASQLVDEALTIIANVVTASNPRETYMTGQPFWDLLEYFGAEVSGVGIDPGGTMVLGREDVYSYERLHFKAPNEVVANQIENAIRVYLESDRKSEANLPPWYDHETNFGKILAKSQYLNAKQIALLQREAQGHIEIRVHLDKLNRVLAENHALISRAELWREGLEFRFEKFVFGDGELGLAALIAYLEANGFTDIRISYGYEPREPEDY